MRYHDGMRRMPSTGGVSFGPGPLTPAVRAILFTNVAMFILTIFAPRIVQGFLGLRPAAVLEAAWIWQLVTYMFVHALDPMHILFNMLGLWMFGVELERRWGTRAFTKYYFIAGIGAGVCVVLASLLPFPMARASYAVPTIGASGAIFGLMLAWALAFPERHVLFMFVFPLPARVFVAIMAALQLYYTYAATGAGISTFAHLGGLLVGYLYLRMPAHPLLEWKYLMTKWRMERMRRKFDVHRGGKGGGWNDRIH